MFLFGIRPRELHATPSHVWHHTTSNYRSELTVNEIIQGRMQVLVRLNRIDRYESDFRFFRFFIKMHIPISGMRNRKPN